MKSPVSDVERIAFDESRNILTFDDTLVSDDKGTRLVKGLEIPVSCIDRVRWMRQLSFLGRLLHTLAVVSTAVFCISAAVCMVTPCDWLGLVAIFSGPIGLVSTLGSAGPQRRVKYVRFKIVYRSITPNEVLHAVWGVHLNDLEKMLEILSQAKKADKCRWPIRREWMEIDQLVRDAFSWIVALVAGVAFIALLFGFAFFRKDTIRLLESTRNAASKSTLSVTNRVGAIGQTTNSVPMVVEKPSIVPRSAVKCFLDPPPIRNPKPGHPGHHGTKPKYCDAGMHAFKEENYVKAAACFFVAASTAQKPQAMRMLADCYLSGKGVICWPEMAFAWYKKSAEMGDRQAMLELSKMYDQGIGVEKNAALAEEWRFKGREVSVKPGHIGTKSKSLRALTTNTAQGVVMPVTK